MAHGRVGGNTVVAEIRIYVEGGGEGANGKAKVRQGFGQFLDNFRTLARQNRIKWSIIACGPRNTTYRNFTNALIDHPTAFNILLVDSEGTVHLTPWQHLQQQDGWSNPGVEDEQCQLMVQMIEAWLVADLETLKKFYGPNFRPNALPKTQNVEQIPKDKLEVALKSATKDTKKGIYHKINHGPDILAQLDVSTVQRAAPHCDRFVKILTKKLSGIK